jgi:arylamine N-acetyltransferase
MCYRETKSFWTKTVSLRKLLKENAGGLCYELNRLFQWLLTELGYRAKLVAATVLNEQGEWVHQDSHATTIVSLDEKSYVVDVGFGDCVREPLPLSGEEIHDVSGTYRIIPVIGTALSTYKRSRAKSGSQSSVFQPKRSNSNSFMKPLGLSKHRINPLLRKAAL